MRLEADLGLFLLPPASCAVPESWRVIRFGLDLVSPGEDLRLAPPAEASLPLAAGQQSVNPVHIAVWLEE